MPESTGVQNSQQRLLAWVTLAILLAITAYAALRIVGPYIEALLAGAALATLFHPLLERLLRRVHRPQAAAWICTTLLVVAVLTPLIILTTTIISQVQDLYHSINSGQINTEEYWALLDRWTTRIGLNSGQAELMIRSRLQEFGSAAAQRTVAAAGAATTAILQLIVMVGAFHVSLLNGAWLHEQTLQHSPLGKTRTETLLETIRQMIRASFYGVVAVAAVQGVLLGIAAWIAGLPIPGLWGLVTAGLSVLPILGSALVWIPGAIFLFAQGQTAMAIFFLLWGAILVANSDNVVRPLIVMNSLQEVNGLLVFIAILGGIQAFGFTGVLAGPVTLAVGIALLRMLREELHDQGAA